jgi:hypothetical protein
MPSWRYKVTLHNAEQILDHLPETVEEIPPAIYCDDQGKCYFDEGPNAFTQAIEYLLTDMGGQGWELVQITFRPDQMICFWKQPK